VRNNLALEIASSKRASKRLCKVSQKYERERRAQVTSVYVPKTPTMWVRDDHFVAALPEAASASASEVPWREGDSVLARQPE